MRRYTAKNGYLGVFAYGRLRTLVRAATVSDNPARDWSEYCEQLNRDGISNPDPGEKRLYPTIRQRIRNAGQTPVSKHLLENETRQSKVFSIVDTQMRGEVAHICSGANLDPIFLKGAALKLLAYQNPWMRRSTDIDIFVPRSSARHAYDAFLRAGWAPGQPETVAHQGIDHILQYAPALMMRHPTGFELDIHWQPRSLLETAPELVRDFDRAAQRIETPNGFVKIPSSTWLFFETVHHGMRRNQVVPIRWMLDAWLLIKLSDESGAAINWPELFDITQRLRATAFLKAALNGMVDAGLPLPQSADIWAQTARPSALERFELWAHLYEMPRIVGTVARYAPNYLLRYPGPLPLRLLRLPRHLSQEVRSYRSWRQVLRHVAQVMSGRI